MAFSVTNTFTNGTTADADEVNTNFTDVENEFNDVSPTANTLTHISPIGSVVAWLKSFTNTPSLPDGWEECNGQVLSDADSVYDGQALPDLNASSGTERFLRGSTTSGTTGGSETETPNITGSQSTGGTDDLEVYTFGGNDQINFAASNNLPSYYEVVWIMRVK